MIPPTAPYLTTARTLPVGPGTKIDAVNDMVASLTGEIFVSDGKGIAVFSATATGNAGPSRYILGNTQSGGGASTAIVPGVIAVDAADNLYVQNTVDSSIDVFGPTDTGTVIPLRTIAGPLARLTSSGAQITGMTTDAAANLYVLCLCSRQDGDGTDFEVLEFGPANGNAAPIRFVTTPGMDSNYFGSGVAVDSAGTIYVSGGVGSWHSGFRIRRYRLRQCCPIQYRHVSLRRRSVGDRRALAGNFFVLRLLHERGQRYEPRCSPFQNQAMTN